MKTWKITITARTPLKPKELMWFIGQKLKETLPIITLDYEELSERPTTTEHHGGMQTENESVSEDIQ